MGDNNDQRQPQTGSTEPEVSFATRDEFTAFVQSKISEALAPKLKTISALESEAAEAVTLRERNAELERKLSGKNLSDEEQWQRTIEEKETQRAALQAQLEAAQQATETTRSQWYATERDRYIQALATEAGAAPSAVKHVPLLFPHDAVKVETRDGSLPTVSIVDPATGMIVNPKEAMQAFLTENPHLRAGQQGGSGSRGAGAPGTPQKRDILDEPDQTGAFLSALGKAGVA